MEVLVDMRLYNCMNCECLPPIGKLPALRFLWINDMDKLERIDGHLCRGGEDQQYHAFPKLEELSIQLKEWAGAQNGDFPCLHKLQIKYIWDSYLVFSFNKVVLHPKQTMEKRKDCLIECLYMLNEVLVLIHSVSNQSIFTNPSPPPSARHQWWASLSNTTKKEATNCI
ncbi:hypothetical protein PIB30_029855 [Stylosanthes scabra]|uniref:Uncharacterized protein n=1 Tax=Stylosanthes scabra TaxID=79078 RepID=A0ABU6YDR5_9FABA|nr:hypothetical protein [Stylosanthes scabra]